MKNKFFNYLQITLALFLFLQAGSVEAQNNLTMKAYQTALVGANTIEGATLDQVFGTVTINGTPVISNFNPNYVSSGFSTIPTTASGFGAVQVVYINGYGSDTISTAQADALIAFVKAGGILLANIEGITVAGSTKATKYIGEALLCNSVTLTVSAENSAGLNPSPAFHSGDGALLVNKGVPNLTTSGGYSIVTGLPSESIIYKGDNKSTCTATTALEFVVPPYPGSNNSCGVKGMALFSGDSTGILITQSSVPSRQASNLNYAQLMFDFLYAPSAMATRRSWSKISTNTSATCPPALFCEAGTTAPTLSSPTLTPANCSTSTSMNLNSLVTSTKPNGTELKWYWDAAHTIEVPNPTSITVSNKFYAFYYDAANDCYSPGASVTTTACVLKKENTCPSSTVDLASTASPAPSGYTLTFHSGTPATGANKLPSSVVNTLGTNTYYAAYWLNGSGQDCYTTTSRPMEVTIKQCCAAQTSPDLTN